MSIDWQPIDTCPDERPILAWHPDGLVVKFDQLTTDHLRRHYGYTHWAPCNPPAPDPMTVAAWHEGQPPQGTTWQSPNTSQPVVIYDRQTVSEGRWCALAPLLDLINEDGDQ